MPYTEAVLCQFASYISDPPTIPTLHVCNIAQGPGSCEHTQQYLPHEPLWSCPDVSEDSLGMTLSSKNLISGCLLGEQRAMSGARAREKFMILHVAVLIG